MEFTQFIISEVHPVIWYAKTETEIDRVMPDESECGSIHISFGIAESEVCGMHKMWVKTNIINGSGFDLSVFTSICYVNDHEIATAMNRISSEYTKAWKKMTHRSSISFTVDPDAKRFIYLWSSGHDNE